MVKLVGADVPNIEEFMKRYRVRTVINRRHQSD
jgi:hypothetical protein